MQYRNLQGTNTKSPQTEHIRNGILHHGANRTPVGSIEFFIALANLPSFAYFPTNYPDLPNYTARKERKGKYDYWIAYKKLDNKLYKTHACSDSKISTEKLDSAARKLAEKMPWPPAAPDDLDDDIIHPAAPDLAAAPPADDRQVRDKAQEIAARAGRVSVYDDDIAAARVELGLSELHPWVTRIVGTLGPELRPVKDIAEEIRVPWRQFPDLILEHLYELMLCGVMLHVATRDDIYYGRTMLLPSALNPAERTHYSHMSKPYKAIN